MSLQQMNASTAELFNNNKQSQVAEVYKGKNILRSIEAQILTMISIIEIKAKKPGVFKRA